MQISVAFDARQLGSSYVNKKIKLKVQLKFFGMSAGPSPKLRLLNNANLISSDLVSLSI